MHKLPKKSLTLAPTTIRSLSSAQLDSTAGGFIAPVGTLPSGPQKPCGFCLPLPQA
jgi:hypothetical protein